jgi:hypothetical protein
MDHLTLNEVIEKLSRLDIVDLVELLDIDPERLCDAFRFDIEEKLEYYSYVAQEYE